MTDTTTLSGAEFQRHAGTDAQKWAVAFIQAFAQAEWDGEFLPADEQNGGLHTCPDCIAFVAHWLRDYAEARVAEEVGRVTARLVPRHDE